MSFNIAIDGPAGAGKSTIARRVAQALSFIYVDTGAMYRAIALYMLEHDVDLGDEDEVTARCPGISVAITYREGEQQVLLNGENVSGRIRSEAVGNAASAVSAYGAVRAKLTELQKELARTRDVVMDGRDIGTSVLPSAQMKIYLTASSHTRALRRHRELEEKGIVSDLAEIEEDIRSRDHRDMNRRISPLCQAADAVLVDSSDMTIDQVVDCILGIYEEKKC